MVDGMEKTQRMPAVFVGHGNPMNAIVDSVYTEAWTSLGMSLPEPKAILCVSAHWETKGSQVTAMQMPRTIHDFGGFPRELFEVSYSAPGSPALAERVKELLSPAPVSLDMSWGLDHGAWAVLCRIFPAATIPVVQLSLDIGLTPQGHFDLAKRLSPLRDEGVLILGSGNLVHNLRAYSWNGSVKGAYPWAESFEALAKSLMISGEFQPLIEYQRLGEEAALAINSAEHYLPLLYVLAQRAEGEQVSFPVSGFDGGSISMLSVQCA